MKPNFEALVDLHGAEILAYLWRILGNAHDAEDCLQDTFLRAFRAFERTDEDWNYRAWLYKIATNVARTQLKKAKRLDDVRDAGRDPDQVDPLEALNRKEQFEIVLIAMTRLSYRQRTAIMMRKYSELDYGVIGEVLDCSPETARAHVYQGLKRLRTVLEKVVNAEGNQHG